MNMNSIELAEKGLVAAKKFVERKGWEIIDECPELAHFDFVAKDENTVVFIGVATHLSSKDEAVYSERVCSRSIFEQESLEWLVAHLDIAFDVKLRCDQIALCVLAENRAILRHHIDALN